jgi:hypothetical protein
MQLGRRAQRKHAALEAAQPEQGRGAVEPRVEIVLAVAGQAHGSLVGEVEAAKGSTGSGSIAATDSTDERTSAASAANEIGSGAVLIGDRLGFRLERVAGHRHRQRPVVGAPRCCTTCASSCVSSSSPPLAPGWYSPRAK